MKSLKNYIYENKVNEELDDNLFWLLDKWFERNEHQQSEFIEIIVKCKETGDKVNIDELKQYLKNTSLEKNLKSFINFLDNDLEPLNNKDYLYALKQVIEVVIGKKEKNKYLENNKEKQVSEKLVINKNTKIQKYNFHPTGWSELKELVKKLIKERGTEADLNDIDVSKMTNLSNLFSSGDEKDFNGDISEWDVSNVEEMEEMFENCKFNGDISNWDVSNVKNMFGMFAYSDFNGDISKWDVSNVTDMQEMFNSSKFNGNISNWDISNLRHIAWMFDNCPLEKNPPKWYKKS